MTCPISDFLMFFLAMLLHIEVVIFVGNSITFEAKNKVMLSFSVYINGVVKKWLHWTYHLVNYNSLKNLMGSSQ